jgi:hypothetical protein
VASITSGARQGPTSIFSAKLAAFMKGVLNTMFFTKLKIVTAVMLVVAAKDLALGSGSPRVKG